MSSQNNGRDNRNNTERRKAVGFPVTARDKRMQAGSRKQRKVDRKK